MRVTRIIIFLLVMTGLIWLVVLLFQNVFSSNNNDTTTPKVALSFVSYANTDAAAVMFIDGPVVVNQDHNAVRITVDRNQSMIEVIKGYDNQVVAQQAFANTQASYVEFLSALDRLGYTKGKDDPALQNDKGSCPFGNRYIYTLSENTKELIHHWTTSCSGGGGTYNGVASQTRLLFLRQVPVRVLNDLAKNVTL